MEDLNLDEEGFQCDDQRAAYIFTPPILATPASASKSKGRVKEKEKEKDARSAKRRKVSTKSSSRWRSGAEGEGEEAGCDVDGDGDGFPRLFDGRETAACARVREGLYERAWGELDERIQDVLRKANAQTLGEVATFIRAAEEEHEKIPAGFIITGPNTTSQDLLFGQLAETLCGDGSARFVRLRSGEVPNPKAALKRIIRDASMVKGSAGDAAEGDGEVDGDESVGQDGRKYLNYDLEALHVSLKRQGLRRVVVAFQDSEAIDNALMSDLIQLFHSWHDRIRFSVLFGIATSVDLFQARLLKSTTRHLYGGQFGVIQSDYVLETVFKTAIAGSKATLRLGPSLLQSLLERQKDQVAGIQAFISSLKYAYLCHFYGNPLSVLLAEDELERETLQPEHIEAIRTLDSFKSHVEAAVDARQLTHAQSLLENDKYLIEQALDHAETRRNYLTQLLRSLHLISVTGLLAASFANLYVVALSKGIDLSSETFPVIDKIRKLGPNELLPLMSRLIDAVRSGNAELRLQGWEADAEDFVSSLTQIQDEVEALVERNKGSRNALKSKYTAQSKVLRTTVVAQKVQLSHDTAALTDDDNAFTKAVDSLTELLSRQFDCEPMASLFLNEVWVYDSQSPYRDVFIPKPGLTFDRALSRPHDYLACSCCKKAEGTMMATLPTTSILYHLYQEAGPLINVADLWTAFYAVIGEDTETNLDERTALVHFYRALAELKTMGFVKTSKKKTDHIAKVKWL